MGLDSSSFQSEFKQVSRKVADAETYKAPKEAELEKLKSIEELKQMRDNHEDKSSNSYIALCLYTYLPPLRSQDWINTKLFYDSSKVKEKDCNYLCLKQKKLFITKYKTAETHGEREEVVPDALVKVLKAYKDNTKATYVIETNKHEKFTSSSFGKFLNRKFGMSSSTIRKVFVSECVDDGMKGKELKQVAKTMGHTVGVQQGTYTRFANICKEE